MNLNYEKISNVLITLACGLIVLYLLLSLSSCSSPSSVRAAESKYEKVVIVSYIGDNCDSGITYHNYKVYNLFTKTKEFISLDDIGVFAPNDTIFIK